MDFAKGVKEGIEDAYGKKLAASEGKKFVKDIGTVSMIFMSMSQISMNLQYI